MKNYLNRLPQELLDLIKSASDISSANGMPAYLVGGFVRDLILGVKNFDLDIVVEGDAIRFAQDFSCRCQAKIISHRRFGTATAYISGGLKIDFATARKETYPQNACLPVVTFGKLEDDLSRRDFTINAMAISIRRDNFGGFIDLFGGRKDLRHKLVRFLHNLSFIDDPTRILRAIRFEQRYAFRIEPMTLKYLKESSRLKMLQKVEPQRLRDELILILKEDDPIKPVKRIRELVGLDFLSQGMPVSRKTLALLRRIQGQIRWFRQAHVSRRKLDSWVMYFMALMDSRSTAQVRDVCRRFVFRKGEEKRIMDYKQIKHSLVLELCRKAIKPSRLFACLEPLSYEVTLLLKSKYKSRSLQKNIADFLKMYNGMRIYTTGEHLKEFGLLPGPAYQRIFRKVLDARLNGQVKTKEEELCLVKKILDKK